MGINCCKNQDELKKPYIPLEAQQNSQSLAISTPIDLFDILGKQAIERGFKDAAEEIIKADAKNRGSHVVNSILPALKNNIDMWAMLSSQEGTSNKLHQYYTQQQIPFTPEMFFLFNMNASPLILKSLDPDIDIIETVNYVIGEEMILIVNRSRSKKLLVVSPKDFFIVKVIKRLPNKDIIEFNTSVQFTGLNEMDSFQHIKNEIKNEALVYLAGMQLQRDDKGSMMYSFTNVDLLSSVGLTIIKPFLKRKIKNYNDNMMSKISDFALKNSPDQDYIWFTDDKNDIQRVFSENQALLRGSNITVNVINNNITNLDDSTMSINESFDPTISKLREVLLSKIPEDKIKAKEILKSTVDTIEKELELKAEKIKKSDNMFRFSELRLKSQLPGENLSVKIDSLVEQIRKDGENIKFKLEDAVENCDNSEDIENVFSNHLVCYQQRYKTELDKTEQTIQQELEDVKEDIESMARTIERSEGQKFKNIPSELSNRAHQLEKVEEDISKYGSLIESTVHVRIDHRQPIDQLEKIEETPEEVQPYTVKISPDEEAKRIESEFNQQLHNLTNELENTKVTVHGKLSQLKNNSTASEDDERVRILNAKNNISNEMSKYIENTRKSLTQVRDRLNKNVITTDKYLADIKNKHITFNETILLKRKNQEDLEFQYNMIQNQINQQLEKQQQLETQENTIDSTIIASELKEQDLNSRQESIQAVLNEEDIQQQRIADKQFEISQSIEDLNEYTQEIEEKKASLQQIATDDKERQHEIEKEISKVNEKIQEEAVKRRELELQKEAIDSQIAAEKIKSDQLTIQKNIIIGEIQSDKIQIKAVTGDNKKTLEHHVKELEVNKKEINNKIESQNEIENHLLNDKNNIEEEINNEEKVLEELVVKKEEMIFQSNEIANKIKSTEAEIIEIIDNLKENNTKLDDLSKQKAALTSQIEVLDQTRLLLESDKNDIDKLINQEGGNKKKLKEKKKKIVKKLEVTDAQRSDFLIESDKIAEKIQESTLAENNLTQKQRELGITKQKLEKEQQDLFKKKNEVDRSLERAEKDNKN